MRAETKPKGLNAEESWAWENSEPGSWARRALARACELRTQKDEIWSPAWRLASLRKQAQQIDRGAYVPEPGLAAAARARSPLYVRFGDPPESGRSSTGRREWAGPPGMVAKLAADEEEGVSVFRGHWRAGALVVDTSEGVPLAASLLAMSGQDRPVYLATGTEIGTGTAGEPLLRGVEVKPVLEGTPVLDSGEWSQEARAVLCGFRLRELWEQAILVKGD